MVSQGRLPGAVQAAGGSHAWAHRLFWQKGETGPPACLCHGSSRQVGFISDPGAGMGSAAKILKSIPETHSQLDPGAPCLGAPVSGLAVTLGLPP